MGTEGLRERKKRETRQRIADVATELFLARGFDEVTVAEVAEAAEVSKMTVFNYFSRKEDMFFDRDVEGIELLTAAVTGRAAGVSVLGAVHELLAGLLAEGHPLLAVGDNFRRFFTVVAQSPTLQARSAELMRQLEDTLTELTATATGAAEDDPMPRVVAALAITGWRTAYEMGVRASFEGRKAAQIRPVVRQTLDRMFAGLQQGFPDYGARAQG